MLDNLIQVSPQPNVKLNSEKSNAKDNSKNEDFAKYMQTQTSEKNTEKATLKAEKKETAEDKKETKQAKKDDKKTIEQKNQQEDAIKGELNPNEVFGTLFHILKIAKDLNLKPNFSAPILELKEAKTIKDIMNIAKKYNLNITKIEFSKDEEKLDIKTALNDEKTAPKILQIVDSMEQKIKQAILQSETTKNISIKDIKNDIKNNEKVSLASILSGFDSKKTKTEKLSQENKESIIIKDIKTNEKIDEKIIAYNQKLDKDTNLNEKYTTNEQSKDLENTKDIDKKLSQNDVKNDEKLVAADEKSQKKLQDEKISKNEDMKIDEKNTKDLKNDEKISKNKDVKIDEKLSILDEKPKIQQNAKTEENIKTNEKIITKDNTQDMQKEIVKKLSDEFVDEKTSEKIINKNNIDGEKLLGSLLKGLKDTQNGEKAEPKLNSLDEFVKTINENKIKENNKTIIEQFFSEKYQDNTKNSKLDFSSNNEIGGIKLTTNIETNQSKTFVKETLPSFANDLKEVVEKYKPPVSRIKINLNPAELGEIEVSVRVRGNSLNIQLNSQNHTTTNLFITHQIELRNTLVAMGFSGLDMNFSQKQEQENKKNQNKQTKKDEEQNEENENQTNVINLNVPLSNFELKA